MKNILNIRPYVCLIVLFVLGCALTAARVTAEDAKEIPEYVRAGKIMLFDKQRNIFLHGKITVEGNIMLHDGKGNFLHGKVREGGKVSMHDGKGSFMHGTLKEDGELRLFSPGGRVFHGRVVWANTDEEANE